MPFPISERSIEAIAGVISGGSYNSSREPIGLYRSGLEIERFMHRCKVDFQVEGSRVSSLVDCLNKINGSSQAARTLTRVIESAADPRDFVEEPSKHQRVEEHLNQFLAYDRLKLQRTKYGMRLVPDASIVSVFSELSDKAKSLQFDNVQDELGRIKDNTSTDPSDAVTAACSLIEGICRSILVQLGQPLPKKKTLVHLYKAVNEHLDLSPERTDIDQDITKILSNLASLIQGIGELRTHAGDAHGQEHGRRKIDSRIAALAVNSACTIGFFLIETWQRKYPDGTPHRSDD